MPRYCLLSLCGLLVLAALAGCHNRAYSDLYVENMAAEIRDLEDQLYEFDHEYHLLEQEVASLRAANAALQSHAPSVRAHSGGPQSGTQPLQFQPRNGMPIIPDPMLDPDAEAVPFKPQSILEGDRQGSATPRSPYSNDELPSPRLSAEGQSSPDGNQPQRLPPPNRQVPDSGTNLPSSPESQPPNSQPSGSRADANPPGLRAPSSLPSSDLPKLPGVGGDEDLDFEELLPPTIDPGEPMPPPLPVVTQQDGRPVPPERNLDMNLSRVDIPAKLASQINLAKDDAAPRDMAGQATIQVATEKVTDMRVVELAFHPTLSRAINLDDRNDDDGVYLVLQPKNEQGQMVAVAAELSIAILDPAKEGQQAHIGRWDYSAAEVQAKLRPIGSSQGIHLQLPWNGPDPTADRVIVFALYKFENGRQVMGEKEIFVSSDGGYKTVWAPRAGPSTSTSETATAVRTASGQEPIHPESRELRSANLEPRPSLTPGRVVRPAASTLDHQSEPPPAPAGNASSGW